MIITDIAELHQVSTPYNLPKDIKEAIKVGEDLKSELDNSPNPGMGLCGPQIGVLKRIIFINHWDEYEQLMINPEIIKSSSQTCNYAEGCLSLPDTIKNPVNINRPKQIKIRYTDANLQIRTEKFNGLRARAIQHEIDHLDGILIIDRAREETT